MMLRWSRKHVPALVLLFMGVAVVVVSAGYFVFWESEVWAGRFLFIESRTIVEAQVLEGKWGRLIDFPYYWYNVSTGRIEYSGKPFDLDKLLAVYGSLLAYRGARGTTSFYPIGGTSSCLYPIYSTPCALCDGTSSLDSIDKDGTAHITYENKQIVLSLNQQWRTENETIEHFKEAVVRFKETTTIENLGFWKKANIRTRSSLAMFSMYSAMLHVEDRATKKWPTCSRWSNSHLAQQKKSQSEKFSFCFNQSFCAAPSL